MNIIYTLSFMLVIVIILYLACKPSIGKQLLGGFIDYEEYMKNNTNKIRDGLYRYTDNEDSTKSTGRFYTNWKEKFKQLDTWMESNANPKGMSPHSFYTTFKYYVLLNTITTDVKNQLMRTAFDNNNELKSEFKNKMFDTSYNCRPLHDNTTRKFSRKFVINQLLGKFYPSKDFINEIAHYDLKTDMWKQQAPYTKSFIYFHTICLKLGVGIIMFEGDDNTIKYTRTFEKLNNTTPSPAVKNWIVVYRNIKTDNYYILNLMGLHKLIGLPDSKIEREIDDIKKLITGIKLQTFRRSIPEFLIDRNPALYVHMNNDSADKPRLGLTLEDIPEH